MSKTYSATEAHFAFNRESYEAGYLVGLLNAVGFSIDAPTSGPLAEIFKNVAEADPTAERARARLAEIVLQHLVDQYLVFLAQLLAEIYRARPETMRSRDEKETPPSVGLDVVLQHDTIEALVGAIVETRVLALSYKSLADLARYFESQLGFKLYDSDEELQQAILIVEVRNLLTHNRGVVNEVFLKRVATSPWKLGERIRMEPELIAEFVQFLLRTSGEIDDRALVKWTLPAIGVRHRTDGMPDERIGVWDPSDEDVGRTD